MISIKNLSKYYGDKAIIRDISFEILEGEIVGLLGINGAGKSTILKMLGCYLAPSAGEIVINGFESQKYPYEIRKIIGYLPDRAPLYDEMTAWDYLKYVAKLKDINSKNIISRVHTVMEKVSIEEVARTPLSELSHGFRQRVSIAQALINNPKVLILDEPINGLDPIQIRDMRDLILSLKGEHTVVLSSHILSEITKTCDRVLMINDGKIILEGKEEDIIKSANKAVEIHCLVQGFNSFVLQEIEKMECINSVKIENKEAEITRLMIHTNSEARALIAKTLIDNNVDLLEMQKGGEGLENIFIQLIKDSKETNNV